MSQHPDPAQDAAAHDNSALLELNSTLLLRLRALEAGAGGGAAAAASQPAAPCAKCEEESRRWLGRARALSNDTATITIGDQRYTKRQCYIRALEANPDNGAAWGDLGGQAYRNLVINGRDYSQADDNDGVVLCYEQQLRCTPHDSRAWQLLASHLGAGGGARSINGKLLTQFQCYERALLHDARNAAAWLGLAYDCFDNNQDLIEVNGEPMGRLACWAQIIGATPLSIDARDPLHKWNALDDWMNGTDDRVTIGGVAYGHAELDAARAAVAATVAAQSDTGRSSAMRVEA